MIAVMKKINLSLFSWMMLGIAIIGIAATALVYQEGLTLALVDAQSHLNFGKLFFDSSTPGISQIGFWPPLLHALLVVPTQIPFLYETGLAAAIVLIPVLGIGAYYLYKLIFLLTASTRFSIAGVVIFALNPFVLYYASVPMMETLFLSMMTPLLFYFVKWQETGKIAFLLYSAFFVSLACLARFDGFAFIPVFVIAAGGFLLSRKVSKAELEATLVLAAPLFLIGVIIILSYSSIYGDSPFEFLSGKWSAFSQQKFLSLPSRFSLSGSVTYLSLAAFSMLGKGLSFAGIIGLIILTCIRRAFGLLLIVLASMAPAALVVFTLFTGSTVIYLPTLPPFTEFFNERYGLTLFLPAVLATIFGSYALTLLRPSRRFLRQGLFVLSWALLSFGMLSTFAFSLNTFFGNKFSLLKEATVNIVPRTEEQKVIGQYFCDHPPTGYVLMTRALLNAVPIHSCTPLKQFIIESNFPFFEQTIERPWLYAEYVVLHNENTASDYELSSDEPTRIWSKSRELFDRFYAPVQKTAHYTLYRLDQGRVRGYAEFIGLPEEKIYTLQEVRSKLSSRYYEELGVASAKVLVDQDDEYLKKTKQFEGYGRATR